MKIPCPACKTLNQIDPQIFFIRICDRCKTAFYINMKFDKILCDISQCYLCKTQVTDENLGYRWEEEYGWFFLCDRCTDIWKKNYPNHTLRGFIEDAERIKL